MSTNDNSASKNNSNEDILKSFRHLSSCITLTSVKDTPTESKSPSASEESSEEDSRDATPSALKGISIAGGAKGAQSLLNDLLSKKQKKEEAPKESGSSWINEWSKRCLSISFSSGSKGATGAAPDADSRSPSRSPAEAGHEPPDDAGVKGRGLENGSPPSSPSDSHSADSDSRDSIPEKEKLPSTFSGGNISIRPLGDVSKFLSVTVVKGNNKSQQDQTQKRTAPSPVESAKEPKQPRLESRASAGSLDPPTPDSNEEPTTSDEEREEEEEERRKELYSAKEKSITPGDGNRAVEELRRARLSEGASPDSEPSYQCSFCSHSFNVHSDLIAHIPKCRQLGCSVSFSSVSSGTTPRTPPRAFARKTTHQKSPARDRLACVRCKLYFHSWLSFERHHVDKHLTDSAQVRLKRAVVAPSLLEGSEDSNSRESSCGSRTNSEKSLKITLKISNVRKRGRGRKATKVRIVSGGAGGGSNSNDGAPDANETPDESRQQGEGSPGEDNAAAGAPAAVPNGGDELERETGNGDNDGHNEGDENVNDDPLSLESSLPPPDGSSTDAQQDFGAFATPQLNFGAAAGNERPPSTYQPQFESFPGDWFNEYESGSRIAAAMTGATGTEGAQHADRAAFNSNSSGSESGYGTEDPRSRTSPYSASGSSSDPSKDLPVSSTDGRDGGLFSQAVLGGEAPTGSDEGRQGSFEQLCLNDSFGQTQQNSNMSQQGMDQSYSHNQSYHNQQGQGGGDLLSELAYLNNGQQIDPSGVGSMEAERPSFNSHGSNSGTPTSSGHPTPPPSDTSFRALATSPLNSPTSPMNAGGPTPPMGPGTTPPMATSTSPLQQMGQMGQAHLQQPLGSQSQDTVAAPRLTIANNLMPTATSSSSAMDPVVNAYGQQWGSGASTAQQSFPNNYMQTSTLATSLGSGTLRGGLPIGYRPSPPARIRGRPPLMGHVGRPPMMRGPGRPPGSTVLPPLIAAPGGTTRGGMMPSLQRLPQYASGPRQPLIGTPQKRSVGPAGQSPSKALRREDINVPSRQKDNECQIIAVANRTGDGMPVISNVQGGRDERAAGNRASSSGSSNESTIHLNDSITLSVRSNSSSRDAAGRSEKTGDAGVVANLLASRGITVAPAAGEKEVSGNGGREERRLPTASDLNLSSAISVHPPTSRDRDGFAVPHPPSAKSSSSSSSSSGSSTSGAVNSSVDRPPRPPTVDLTQELPSGGAMGTRLQCHQCDRTFPTQALLSDHAKVHQQQNQTRMPFKCHLCTAGFSTQKGQQHHYQQFHQLHLSAGDLAIPVVDFRNPVNVQRMARLGIRSFLPLNNLQNRGAGGVVGVPILTLENLHNGQMNLQQWGITDVLTLGPPRTMNVPR